jgi:CRISPR/Cas system-associated endonuclease/helicase Cas3
MKLRNRSTADYALFSAIVICLVSLISIAGFFLGIFSIEVLHGLSTAATIFGAGSLILIVGAHFLSSLSERSEDE